MQNFDKKKKPANSDNQKCQCLVPNRGKLSILKLRLFFRVWIIASNFANCKVNSSYCDCKVVNHTKIAKQFFSQGKFNLLKLYFSTLYPYFIHPLHTIIKRNIVHAQNYTTKSKKCLAVLKHFHLWRGKSLTRLGIFLWSEFQMIIWMLFFLKIWPCKKSCWANHEKKCFKYN